MYTIDIDRNEDNVAGGQRKQVIGADTSENPSIPITVRIKVKGFGVDSMGRNRSAAEAYEGEWDYEETTPDDESRDRTVVLIKTPIPRKLQLMASA